MSGGHFQLDFEKYGHSLLAEAIGFNVNVKFDLF